MPTASRAVVGGGGAGGRPGRRRVQPGRKGCARLLEPARQARSPWLGARKRRRPGPIGPERAGMRTTRAVGNSTAGDDGRRAPASNGVGPVRTVFDGAADPEFRRYVFVPCVRSVVDRGTSSRTVLVATAKGGAPRHRASPRGVAKTLRTSGNRNRAGPRKRRHGHRRARAGAVERHGGTTARKDVATRGRRAGSRARGRLARLLKRAGRAARSRATRRPHRRAARPPARRRTRPVRASSGARPRRTRRARPRRPRGSVR